MILNIGPSGASAATLVAVVRTQIQMRCRWTRSNLLDASSSLCRGLFCNFARLDPPQKYQIEITKPCKSGTSATWRLLSCRQTPICEDGSLAGAVGVK